MNTLEALEIFNIVDISNIDETLIKKVYRAWIRKNHPDVGGNTESIMKVNCAYELLGKLIDKLKKYKELSKKEMVTWLIPFDKLSKIYMGESIEGTHNNSKITLSRKNLKSDRVIVLITANIQYKGNILPFEGLCVTNQKDEYTLDCKIADKNALSSEDIKIKISDKEVNTIINGNRLDIKLSFDNLVKLTIHVERVVENG